MLNQPILKFDKSIKYLETQINLQKNNKQLILDIISNIGLILNNSSSEEVEHLNNVLDTANEFLQNISNNIITLEQLNLEISNITKDLNDILENKSQAPKTKEYYIATFSNIKNNIVQYTESFQEIEKKLEIDNSDFNKFINDNDFKYNFNEIKNSETNYEFTSFSINNETASLSTESDINLEIETNTNNENVIVSEFENNIEFEPQPEINTNEESENNIESFESISNEDIIDNASDIVNISNEENSDETTYEISNENIELSEKDKKIEELTNEFKEILVNMYDTGITDLDFNSIIINSIQELIPKNDENVELDLLEDISVDDIILEDNATNSNIEEDYLPDEMIEVKETFIEELPVENINIEENNEEDFEVSDIENNSDINLEPASVIEFNVEEAIANININHEESTFNENTTEEIVENIDESIFSEELEKDPLEDFFLEVNSFDEFFDNNMEENISSELDNENYINNSNQENNVILEEELISKYSDLVNEISEENIIEEPSENDNQINNIVNEANSQDVLPEVDENVLEEIPSILEENSNENNEDLTSLLDTELTDLLNSEFEDKPQTTKKKNEKIPKKDIPTQKRSHEVSPIEELINKIESAEEKNKVLIISERLNCVYLPYRLSELKNYMSYYPNVYSSLSDVVKKEFVLDLSNFRRNPSKSRFDETYNLIKNRSGKSAIKAFSRARKLSHKTDLDPVVIAACKTDYELDCYLDCMQHNKLETFTFFKILYEALPITKKNK